MPCLILSPSATTVIVSVTASMPRSATTTRQSKLTIFSRAKAVWFHSRQAPITVAGKSERTAGRVFKPQCVRLAFMSGAGLGE